MIVLLLRLFISMALLGPAKLCKGHGLLALHSSRLNKQVLNLSFPSITLITSINVNLPFSSLKKNPPLGPFFEDMMSFLDNKAYLSQSFRVVRHRAAIFRPRISPNRQDSVRLNICRSKNKVLVCSPFVCDNFEEEDVLVWNFESMCLEIQTF